ncbi:hypothetical protein O181_090897 [Austropuccinia psidii MF-1]|uniref:Uncharacterized protein n=1 Tax=Austropuccinia psidii MF-1 TaxID=1389203 RepID=A0A9Q3P836_9BASI|nr:hypothetical protein [Austropuccinia psidii MF-1]
MAAIRRLFKDPNHLYLQELGWHNSFRIIQGQFSRGITLFQSVVKVSSIQYSLDNPINPYRPHSINLYGLGPIGPFHITLWEFHHTVQSFKMARTVLPNRDNTAIDPPSRINLSVFTYTGYLSSPGDFFPS